MKMADLKAFVETKLLSKSEKALEKIGQEEPKMLFEQVNQSGNLISSREREQFVVYFTSFYELLSNSERVNYHCDFYQLF